MAKALKHEVDLSAASAEAGREEALEEARCVVLAHSAAHRVLRVAQSAGLGVSRVHPRRRWGWKISTGLGGARLPPHPAHLGRDAAEVLEKLGAVHGLA